MPEHGPEASPTGNAPTRRKRKPAKRGRRKRKQIDKPTAAEMEIRILTVMQLLVAGNRPRHIRRYVAENHADWGDVSTRTIDRYVATATAELSKIADEPRATAKSKARARYEMVIKEATESKQWEVVRKANRDLARLDGLEPGLRVQHAGTIGHDVSGAVAHEHTHTHTSGSVEDRANRISDLLGVAAQRRMAAQANNSGNN